MNKTAPLCYGTEHRVDKDGVKLLLWYKCAVDPGASWNSSAMEFFTGRGYDSRAADMWRVAAAPPRPATTTPRSRTAPRTGYRGVSGDATRTAR